MADMLAPAMAALELNLTKPEGLSTVSLELDELSFDRPFTKDQVESFKLYNICDAALVFRWQYKTQGSSRYIVKPACGAIPARSYMTITVTRLQDPSESTTYHTEDHLRLLYSFLSDYDAKKTPMQIWESRPSTLYFQEITAQLAPPNIEPGLLNCEWIEVPGMNASGQVSAMFKLKGNRFPSSGSFSQVSQGTFRWWEGKKCRDMNVAVKMIKLPKSNGDQDEKQRQTRVRRRFIKERNAWSELVHPRINFMHCAVPANPYIFISPWCEKGGLDDNIRNHGGGVRLKWMRQISEGLEYLHERNIIHGDLKTNNILLGDNDDVLITDFGLSKVFNPAPDEMTPQCQELSSLHTTNDCFKALELWQGVDDKDVRREPSKESDVYAFGGTALHIASDEGPFWKSSNNPVAIHNRLKTRDFPRPNEHPKVKSSESLFWNFLNDCWKESPKQRPDASDVMARLREMREDDIWPPGNLRSSRTTM
ncbi:hypothetical protein FRB94_007908 [Tulasnella sp. JGI-2019a]|nr:hypothetical protein FRB93_007321 [Tulasnella sp. JGI-2019a]KAG8996979.1 hypothetical protein FRB94_007908 [Tulasnella sp. JGI-2019a]